MAEADRHPYEADASFDGGDLDCGNGLLLLIRQHIDPLERGQLLEFRSTEISVGEDFPAWCRMTGNELVSLVRRGKQRSFLVCKGTLSERSPLSPQGRGQGEGRRIPPPAPAVVDVVIPATLPPPAHAPTIPPLAVMGIGSWPRPRWMREAIHARLEGRLGEAEFEATADDAVRLAVAAQIEAGVDVVTDGEQRRDNYASFVGARLDNCQLIPLTDLLPLVDDPEKFEAEMRALDVPAVRGAPSRSLRSARAEPLPRRSRARVREDSHRQAREGGVARPVPAHPNDVDGVHLGSRLPLTRAPGPRHRARAAGGDPFPPRRRRGAGAARRARAGRGGLHRRQERAELHVRRPQREGRRVP